MAFIVCEKQDTPAQGFCHIPEDGVDDDCSTFYNSSSEDSDDDRSTFCTILTDDSPRYMHAMHQTAFFPSPFSLPIVASQATPALTQPVAPSVLSEVRTSLFLRNLPVALTRSNLMSVLQSQGLATSVDFLYAPVNIKIMQNCGYAFVNFVSPEAAVECMEKMQGFHDWGVEGRSFCEVSWCVDYQGFQSHVERYRNSAIMHESVNEEFKPAIFKDGSRIPFPLPSKPLRAPRLRKA